MSKILAFGVELARVDAIEEIITDSCKAGRTPRETAVLIEEVLSRPQDGFPMVDRVASALDGLRWGLPSRPQSLRSLVSTAAAQGWFTMPFIPTIRLLAETAMNEARIPTMAMVDAGQAELNAGATTFLRIWLKAWEKA